MKLRDWASALPEWVVDSAEVAEWAGRKKHSSVGKLELTSVAF